MIYSYRKIQGTVIAAAGIAGILKVTGHFSTQLHVHGVEEKGKHHVKEDFKLQR